jgi:hypothetical protein
LRRILLYLGSIMGHLYMQITSIFSQVPKKTEAKK